MVKPISTLARKGRALETRLGYQLARARVAAGISQEELAERLRMSRQSVCNMERGRQAGALRRVRELCLALDVDPRDLLELR